jgi:type IV secretion system protein VirB10
MTTIKDMLIKLFTKKEVEPDLLEGATKQKKDGEIRRVSRTPIILGSAASLLLAGCMVYTLTQKSQAQSATEASKKPAAQSSDDSPENVSFLENKQKLGLLHNGKSNDSETLSTSENNVKDSGKLIAQTGTENTPLMTQSNGQISPGDEMRLQQQQQHQQELQQAQEAKRNALVQALQAETTIYSNSDARRNTGSNSNPSEPKNDEIKAHTFKVDEENIDTDSYLPNTRVHAVSKFEVKAGTVIPSVLLGGINSELPGLIKAQVSQNVFDSATGQYLIIPQGAQLVGTYDHQVQNGQRRILVVWNRIIYPDSSSINIQGMSGADQSGYSGFHDKTNTHFWVTARNALLLSAITAGVQLSQPRPSNGDYGYSSQQILASSLGMQMNQVGMNVISQNMNRAPTLTIRPGFVFNVMVNKDMILPPWQGHFLSSQGEP